MEQTLDPNWPPTTRFAAKAAQSAGFDFHELDGGRGYLFSVIADGKTVHFGTGSVPAYPINSQTAAGLCKDKAFCASVLKSEGIAHIPGALFFITDAYFSYRGPGREIDDLRAFVAERLPVFIKPNRGSRGDFAEPVTSLDALEDYLVRARQKHDQMLVQDIVPGTEYRVLVLNGRAVFQYRRGDMMLRGDGKSSWADLLSLRNDHLKSRGLSAIPSAAVNHSLAERGLSLNERSTTNAIPLAGRRNVSGGGEVQDFTTLPDPPLAELASQAAAALNLRIAGVDVIDVVQGDGAPALKVLEVNANPSFSSLESIGREDIAEAIWIEILETLFAAP